MNVPRRHDVRIYVGVCGSDNCVPDRAALHVREALSKIGEGQMSPSFAIQPLAKEARGPLSVSIEWQFGPDRHIGTLIRIDESGALHVVEGGIGFDAAESVGPVDAIEALAVSVGAAGRYEIDYGPRSILRWLANVVEPGKPPEPIPGDPPPGEWHESERKMDVPPTAGEDWYVSELRRAMGDE